MMYAEKPLAIAGYRDEPVPHTFFQQGEATEQVAILLPGLGYTCDMPLLYYASELLLGLGADVLLVEYAYGRRPDFHAASDAEKRHWLFADTAAACRAALAKRPYRKITIVGKSLGTRAMGHLLTTEPAFAGASAIWLTPLLRDDHLLAQIEQSARPSLFVIGTADAHYDRGLVAQVGGATGGAVVVIDGADHSLEIAGDIVGSVRLMERIVRAMQQFLTP